MSLRLSLYNTVEPLPPPPGLFHIYGPFIKIQMFEISSHCQPIYLITGRGRQYTYELLIHTSTIIAVISTVLL